MNKILFGCLIYLFVFSNCFAQSKQGSIWIFGDSAGIDFRDPQNPVPISSSINSLECAASIADNDGNLLFYAGGAGGLTPPVHIWNRNNSVMQNGDNIFSHPSTTQGLMIIPLPNNTNVFYLFHIYDQPGGSLNLGLYYSVVDMSEDQGLGAVKQRNIFLNIDSLTEKMNAVKHANGRDWWLIVHKRNSEEFLRYLITPQGINGPFTQAIGSVNNLIYGEMEFSLSGNKMISVLMVFGLIDLFDFDRCTGLLSNWKQIGEGIIDYAYYYYGCSFSKNENVVYISPWTEKRYIYQYDLTSSNIKASSQTIYSYSDTIKNITLGQHQLGPDGKVYIAKDYYPNLMNENNIYNNNLDVIVSPDSLGLKSNYIPNGFYLGSKRTHYSLPNIPNYNLGAVTGSPCDTIVSIKEERVNYHISLYPNPSNGSMSFAYSFNQNEKGALSFYDITGRKIKSYTLTEGSHVLEINEALQAGVYFYKVMVNEKVVKNEKVVVIRE